jgi:hypothetical protein
MAAHIRNPGKRLTQAELAAVMRLTRDLAKAMTQGDLDRALELLEERHRTLKGVSWPKEADPDFWEEIQVLRKLEQEVLEFGRTWREVVEKRLKSLNTGHFLRMSYCPPVEGSRFIDVNK